MCLCSSIENQRQQPLLVHHGHNKLTSIADKVTTAVAIGDIEGRTICCCCATSPPVIDADVIDEFRKPSFEPVDTKVKVFKTLHLP